MWQQAENGRVVHPFEPAILAATLALIPVMIIERDVSSGAWVTVAPRSLNLAGRRSERRG
jgi:hypothetical protein